MLEHFTKPNHNLDDMMVAVIRADLVDQTRKKREGMRLIFNYKTLVVSSGLRTFTRKSSNIDNFIKLLLLIANELLVSEMQK